MGKLLIFIGLIIIVMGIILLLLERFGLPRLPGDILIKRDNYTIYIPIATSILVSVILSLLLYLGSKFFR